MPRRKRVPSRGTWLRQPGPEADALRIELARQLAPHELAALGSYYWEGWARDEQLPPREAWRTWLICAGRGFGKTRAGAEWVRQVARSDPAARIALVGASLAEVRSVMVEGDSGVLAAAPGALAPLFEPSLRRLTWENGAIAWLYSAGEPDSLRGPQHSHVAGPGPEGILRQRGPQPGRCLAALRRRRHRFGSAGFPRRWPELAGRNQPERRLGRSGRKTCLSPGGQLAVRRPLRRNARSQSRDRPGAALFGRLDRTAKTRRSNRRGDR